MSLTLSPSLSTSESKEKFHRILSLVFLNLLQKIKQDITVQHDDTQKLAREIQIKRVSERGQKTMWLHSMMPDVTTCSG